MPTFRSAWPVLTVLLLFLPACSESPAPETSYDADLLHQRVLSTIDEFKRQRPAMAEVMKTAYAYAVLPSIGTGAIGIGGAYGDGEVFQGGILVGYCDVSQASIGAQIGGQEYSEMVFFKDQAAFTDFMAGQTAFDARASAVAAADGAATAADYRRGILVYTMAQGGLMAQAAIGGQHFRYEAKK